MRKFLIFTKETYAIGLHLAYSVAIFLAFYAACLLTNTPSDVTWSWGTDDLISMATIFVILFYIRVLDEIKDYEYDCKFNPDRPLVKGDVTLKNL
ncbi:MAG: hypothetical protein HQK51_15685, partial [Oligoflexia bacterium]|nr:hypothetical protein [Oligoflexia bacterium]